MIAYVRLMGPCFPREKCLKIVLADILLYLGPVLRIYVLVSDNKMTGFSVDVIN